MKNRFFMSVAVAALILVGCSKQPNLENAENVTPAKTQQNIQAPAKKTEESQQKNEVSKENVVSEQVQESESAGSENENVSTENAEVEEENLAPTKISIENTNQDFAKKLSSIVIYFDFDKYNIRPDQWPKVEKLAKLIKSNPSNYTVRIEGNCDEWGTEEYNYALGLKRANSVRNALIKLGVDPKKLTVISYGELNPVCTAHARWCWRLNRRDNFTYLP